ncbi:fibronectin type III domain-containing protein [bacterium]|nr:fibronectin type III domain-containing protein [bacterium]
MSRRTALAAAFVSVAFVALALFAFASVALAQDAPATNGGGAQPAEPGAEPAPTPEGEAGPVPAGDGILVTDLAAEEGVPEPTLENTFNAPLCPPTEVAVKDAPDDAGAALVLAWRSCPVRYQEVDNYVIFRALKGGGGPAFMRVAQVAAGDGKVEDTADGKAARVYEFTDTGLTEGATYVYRVAATAGERFAYAFVATDGAPLVDVGPISPVRQQVTTDEFDKLHGSFAGAPPKNVSAKDRPNDAGDGIVVTWEAPDGAEGIRGLAYNVYRGKLEDGPFTFVGQAGGDETKYVDTNAQDRDGGRPPFYYVVASTNLTADGLAFAPQVVTATASAQFVNFEMWNYFLFAIVLSGFIVYFIQHIKSGKKLFVRKIAGLEAVDEAIGRATEMGKPVLFVPGIMDMNDVQTVAAMSILGRVAQTVAEYDTRLMVPTSKSLVMTTGRETVKESYISAGRPDAYNEDIVTYLTDEQFGYVAGVNGIMVREKPATILYLGSFYAESLIMAETGNFIGAIQIAGTAQPAQLPFFVAACDYTLIGEELFAASAYLSHDPKQLGSLKGQDVGKLLGMLGIVFGSLFATIEAVSGAGWAKSAMHLISELFRPAAG